ncbi:MAG: hypothetical protein VKP62_14490 [Candidatus Sericytochromatia bacterium]|nr:hypothetical protein [Candidatus Sericytochromatia bacterium]
MAQKCFYHPKSEAVATCEGCRLSICANCDEEGLCRDCRNKRKAVADRKRRMGGEEGGDASGDDHGDAGQPEEKPHVYDPDRYAYRRPASQIIVSKKQPARGSGLMNPRIALFLGAMMGVAIFVTGPNVLGLWNSELLASFSESEVAPPAGGGDLPPGELGAPPPEAAPGTASEPSSGGAAAAAPAPAGPSASPTPDLSAQRQNAALWASVHSEAMQVETRTREHALTDQAALQKAVQEGKLPAEVVLALASSPPAAPPLPANVRTQPGGAPPPQGGAVAASGASASAPGVGGPPAVAATRPSAAAPAGAVNPAPIAAAQPTRTTSTTPVAAAPQALPANQSVATPRTPQAAPPPAQTAGRAQPASAAATPPGASAIATALRNRYAGTRLARSVRAARRELRRRWVPPAFASRPRNDVLARGPGGDSEQLKPPLVTRW